MGDTNTNVRGTPSVSRVKRQGKTGWRKVFENLLNYKSWSLKARFLVVTGCLLILGNLSLILFFTFSLDNEIGKNANDRLQLLLGSFNEFQEQEENFLLSQAIAVANMPTVKQMLLSGDADVGEAIGPIADKVRMCTEMPTLLFQVFDAKGRPYTGQNGRLTRSREVTGELFNKMKETRMPMSGVISSNAGPLVAAVSPITEGDSFLGCSIISIPITDILKHFTLPIEFGISLVIPHGDDADSIRGRGWPEIGNWFLIDHRGKLDLDPARYDFVTAEREGSSGPRYVYVETFSNHQGDMAGALIMSFDADQLKKNKWNTILLFGLFFTGGAFFLWIFLYLNTARVEDFLNRLKTIILSSHSNYFAERFEADTFHCLDVLHCHNEECPVYQNPQLVCYLETGSEAISPKWRNTCIYLNKYETCAACPVYKMRKGDELHEMRNVVNTMMRLWSDFLSRVGHLLAYVLRAQETTGQTPSLDDISDRLEQMAKLTFFSHDLQGVLDKDEVYRQLAHVIENTFHIHDYVIYEVDQESDRILVVHDKMPGQELCKQQVMLATEFCRAYRVVEDIVSFYNPVLCPNFNCDTTNKVRCCLPIVMGSRVGAIFTFLSPKRDWEKTRKLVPVIRKYLDETGPILSSLRLLRMTKDQSLRDPLTHCHNRRFLDEYITKYEPLSEREGRRNGFLMADLDYFKQVNDVYGHQAGDAVLEKVVNIIQNTIRRSDMCIRYGGEEFLVLLQNVKNETSMHVAEKIRTAIEQCEFEMPDGTKLHKTISIGVSEYPDDADTLYKAIKFADVALYEAKHKGRNKVIRFEAHMWQSDEY